MKQLQHLAYALVVLTSAFGMYVLAEVFLFYDEYSGWRHFGFNVLALALIEFAFWRKEKPAS